VGCAPSGRYTLRIVRRATALTAGCLALLVAGPAVAKRAAPPSAPAELLGDAYRAFTAGNFESALAIGAQLDSRTLENPDYAEYVVAQSAFLLGEYQTALDGFRALAKRTGSRFRAAAPWRVADCLHELGDRAAAVKAYEALLASGDSAGDAAVAKFRIAAAKAAGKGKQAKAALASFKSFLLEHPAHPLAAQAEAELLRLGGERAAALDAEDRIQRATRLTAAHLWHEAIAELALIGDDVPAGVARRRDYWTGMTLFKMRRRYEDAGRLLLAVHPKMGKDTTDALFHGARALSRADKDEEAITWYQHLVEKYPRSDYAAEAQYLTGWLKFNLGKYREAIPALEASLERYPKSKWVDDAIWFLGFSHYLLGEPEQALDRFTKLAARSGALEAGKGFYWKARTLQQLARGAEAEEIYRSVVGRWPFSWYALLSLARLKEAGKEGPALGPFGATPADPADAPAIDTTVDEKLASDALIQSADELIAAGLTAEAGVELARGESAFLKRHKRSAAMAMLLERYRRADNFNRPWMLSITNAGGRAFDAPAEGKARVWWEHGYPLAYRALIEQHEGLGKNPPYYLLSIMRKETGFDPHVLSYADAIGLLQMIPATTRRVCAVLGFAYTNDLLYQPALNIQTGSWYIGRLLQKFKGQIPFGAGSFNSGPRPVMKWLDAFGDRSADELVELVPYLQTREYMKKVTENYARYVYLYTGEVYEQPLVVDKAYLVDELTY
jgi:soluble lytic murein transglycosylase